MCKSIVRLLPALFLSSLLEFPLNLDAQNAVTLSGRVLDPQSKPVVAAIVTLRNRLTGAEQVSNTGDTGTFTLTPIQPGDYNLIVVAASIGLSAQVRAVQVREGIAPAAIDVTLPVASVQQNVTVVSGSRVEELQQDSPLPIDVVDSERIKRTGYETVADVLSEIPGVVTRNNQSFSGGASQQIDGMPSQDILVLQDGLPVTGARGIKSGIIDLDMQNIGRLDRVEVVRGAASSLYGTDAVGGVINMITRQPTHPFEGGLRLSGGSLGTVDGDLTLGTKWKKLTAFTDLELHRIGSYTLLPNDESTVGANAQRYDGLVKLRYQFTPRAAISFSGNAYHTNADGKATDFSGTATSGYNRAYNTNSTQNYAVIGDLLPTSKTSIQARLYSGRYDENSYQRTLATDSSEGSTQLDYGNLYERYHRADATISQQVFSWNFLQGGFEWAQDSYRGLNRLVGDDAGKQITTDDVWLQDRIQPFTRLIINVGGRYNHHSLYGDNLVPKIGVVYRINQNWTVRSAYGRGFRSPTVGELYYLLLHPEYFYQVIGNPTLRPERSESYSVGTDYQVNRYSFGITLYRNNLDHLINYVYGGFPTSTASLNALLAQYGIPPNFGALPFLATYLYTNVDKAYTQGVNLRGSVLLRRDLRVDGSYSYLDPYDRVNKQTLTERSRNQGFFKTEYVSNRLGMVANVRASFFGKWLIDPSTGQREKAYAIWKLYGSKDLPYRFQIYGAIDNLANSRDSMLNDAQPGYDRTDYGRTFRVGMRYTLGRE